MNINLGEATETHAYVYLIRSILLLEILHIRLLYILLIPVGVGTETRSRYFLQHKTALILLLYTTNTASIHYKYCFYTLQILLLYTTNTASIHFKYCFYTLHILLLYTTNTASICFKYCFYTLQILLLYTSNIHFKYCLYTLQAGLVYCVLMSYGTRIAVSQINTNNL